MRATTDRSLGLEDHVDIVYLVWLDNHHNGADKESIGIFTDAAKAKTCIKDFSEKGKYNDDSRYLRVEPYVLNKSFIPHYDSKIII
jgi:hypothetical protein